MTRERRTLKAGASLDVEQLRRRDVVPIDELLAALGLTGEDAQLARLVLEEGGLTRPGKTNIAAEKVERAREAIDAEIARLCATCAPVGAEGRQLALVPQAACAYCGGSNNQRALLEMIAACERAGVTRLVIVGGSPAVRADLVRAGAHLELRLVDGVERRTKAQARGDIGWADVVVVCGASELYHRVSELYTRDPLARAKLAVSTRRGVEAIANAVTEHLARREAERR